MKMKKMVVQFEKVIAVTVFVPEDMSVDELHDVAQDVAAEGLHDWDEPEWEASVGTPRDIVIPDADLRRGSRKVFGHRKCLVPQFRPEDVLVVSDTRDDIVIPEAATWWIVHDEVES